MAQPSTTARMATLLHHVGPKHSTRTQGSGTILDICTAHATAGATETDTAAPIKPSRPPRLLTTTQLKSFIQTGFVSVSVLDDLGADWMKSFYDRCRQHAQSGSRESVFRQLSNEVDDLLHAPSVAGGLVSLLGPDYLLVPGEFANDGLKLHQARPPGHDQGFHRDGTDHVGHGIDHRPCLRIGMAETMHR